MKNPPAIYSGRQPRKNPRNKKPVEIDSLPPCFGVPPSGLNPNRCNCDHKVGCRLYNKSRPRTLFERAREAADSYIPEKRISFSINNIQLECERLSKLYGVPGKYLGPKNFENMDRIRAFCEREKLDAFVWLEAQFAALGDFFARSRRVALPLNVCLGENARKRYNDFIQDKGVDATGNVRKQEAYEDKFYLPEYMYGHAVLVLRLPKDLLRSYEKDIEQKHPYWDKEDWSRVGKARTEAAMSIVDMLIPESSSMICPPKREWSWEELRDIIDVVRPK